MRKTIASGVPLRPPSTPKNVLVDDKQGGTPGKTVSRELEWHQGEMPLSALGITISLHPLLRISELLIGVLVQDGAQGAVMPTYAEDKKLWAIYIMCYLFKPRKFQSLFIQGHEQTHLCETTGNLVHLYRELEMRNLERFAPMSKEEALECDRRALARIEKAYEPGDTLHTLEPRLSESMADIGGLLAVIKAGLRGSVVTNVVDQIELDRVGSVRGMPKLIRRIDNSF
ncbi:MAG: hypothetical protein Q7S22_06465 [Candidatus Micrarchaeota archaeon]|nr:hypothetical protein [Candidatus Micrarchaeota archaeon]